MDTASASATRTTTIGTIGSIRSTGAVSSAGPVGQVVPAGPVGSAREAASDHAAARRGAPRLRAATPADEPFLFTVGCSLWQAEAAAMPDPRLVDHFLRIQHTVLETRFQQRFPQHERFVIERDDAAVGRLYLHRGSSMLHLVDLTVLPEARGHGTAGRVLTGILDEARRTGQQVSLRIRRDSATAAALATAMGFGLVTVDDLDQCFTWDPATAEAPPADERPADERPADDR